ncbi:MAG TPA: peptidylprolyl isomerase [Thermoanaerobaculia bacterium]|nr:peptidylprolyl isomerase [Thermoanaerobaculia bacterium]
MRTSFLCLPSARRSSLLLGCLLAVAGCATSSKAPDLPNLAVPDLDERALLLLLVDRQETESFGIQRALQGGPELREALAVALGRIPDPQGRSPLVGLLLDDVPAVRRAAAFSLGELEDPEAKEPLLMAVRDPDHEAGLLAVEALGKLKVPIVEVLEALLPLDESERWARVVPYLFRFHEEAMVQVAERGLARTEPGLHARAAYALAREPFPQALPLLRGLAADPDPLVRDWVARALGIVGAGEDLALLRPLLDDAALGPVIQALRAAKRLIDEKKGPAPAEWLPRLAEFAADPRPGVRVTALEAAGAWPLGRPEEQALAAALVARAAENRGRDSGVALVALATGEHPRAAELTGAAAGAADADVRARAAEAAALLGRTDLLSRLAGDPSAEVRGAAVGARLALVEGDPGKATAVARESLADADEGVRATVLSWLGDHPVLPVQELQKAFTEVLDRRNDEVAIEGVQALAARGEAQAEERGAVVALLERTAAAGSYVLRRTSGEALGRLGGTVPRLQAADTGRDLDDYRDIVQSTWRPRTVEIRTAKGPIRVRLACPEAPLTCLNFLQLAGQGYFNGLSFHRVVPDFVIQAGDPRGDGYGGPGYDIRDEINPLRYERGTVGMALAGPDTGGSQFFIALAPQPHLDGGYTVFGQVVQGDEVLDKIQADDRIEQVVEVR